MRTQSDRFNYYYTLSRIKELAEIEILEDTEKRLTMMAGIRAGSSYDTALELFLVLGGYLTQDDINDLNSFKWVVKEGKQQWVN